MFIAKESHIFTMDKANEPVLQVGVPARLTFETLDCFAGQIVCASDALEKLDFDSINPATGPVYLDGIKAGDILKIHIRDIRFKDRGVMVAEPGAGILGHLVRQSQNLIVSIDRNEVHLLNLNLPLSPMIGVIGVAPSNDAIACGTPGTHGGNMDNKLITIDSTLYLPVEVDGALLAMGDLHACMGDGEIMVTGVEASGEVDVTVDKAADVVLQNPMVVTREVVATIASADTLDEAIKQATLDMAALLQNHTGLSLNEAGMLMSAAGDAQICQIVDPLATARFAMPAWIMRRLGASFAF